MNENEKYKILTETVNHEIQRLINELEDYELIGPVQVTSCIDTDFNQREVYVATLKRIEPKDKSL